MEGKQRHRPDSELELPFTFNSRGGPLGARRHQGVTTSCTGTYVCWLPWWALGGVWECVYPARTALSKPVLPGRPPHT